jgi:hypothetical protein
LFQKIYGILAAILLFIFVNAISASAGWTPLSLHADGDAACRRLRAEVSNPWNASWKRRITHWLCYPDYVDPR